MPEYAVDPIVARLVSGETLTLRLTPGALKRITRALECTPMDVQKSFDKDPAENAVKVLMACMTKADRLRLTPEDIEDDIEMSECLRVVVDLFSLHTPDTSETDQNPTTPPRQLAEVTARKRKPTGTG